MPGNQQVTGARTSMLAVTKSAILTIGMIGNEPRQLESEIVRSAPIVIYRLTVSIDRTRSRSDRLVGMDANQNASRMMRALAEPCLDVAMAIRRCVRSPSNLFSRAV